MHHAKNLMHWFFFAILLALTSVRLMHFPTCGESGCAGCHSAAPFTWSAAEPEVSRSGAHRLVSGPIHRWTDTEHGAVSDSQRGCALCRVLHQYFRGLTVSEALSSRSICSDLVFRPFYAIDSRDLSWPPLRGPPAAQR